MLIELVVVILALQIAGISLFASLWILRSIKGTYVRELWVGVQMVLLLVVIGMAIILLDFLQFDIESIIPRDLLTSIIIILISFYAAVSTYMNAKIFKAIFGTGMSDQKALNKFLRFAQLPASAANVLMDKTFDMQCDTCGKEVEYSIPDVVRAHPDIERGIEIEDGLGERNFTLYVRHDCEDDFREIPVQHDKNMVPRSQKESRVVIKI
ncbi:MAG: hypothetical protein OEV06_01670 [Anaerolineae bacterium]|nr:hypothetical protein [Anaerolineae bacterium]